MITRVLPLYSRRVSLTSSNLSHEDNTSKSPTTDIFVPSAEGNAVRNDDEENDDVGDDDDEVEEEEEEEEESPGGVECTEPTEPLDSSGRLQR